MDTSRRCYRLLLLLSLCTQCRSATTTVSTFTELREGVMTASSDVILVSGRIRFDETLVIPYGLNVTIHGSTEEAATLDGRSRFRLFIVEGTLNLENIDIAKGSADVGGAFYVNGTLVMSGCVAKQNTATRGGVVYSNHGSIIFNQVQAQTNTATHGGVVFNNNGSVWINGDDGRFTDNEATAGGVVYNTHGSAWISGNGIYSGNLANSDGSVVYNQDGRMWFDGGRFRTNTANSNGGVVYNHRGSMWFQGDLLFRSNEASADGGVAYNNDGSIYFHGGHFRGNIVNSNGGVAYNNYGLIYFDDGLYRENDAHLDGGVICNKNGSIMLEGGTFRANVARNGGVGYNFGGTSQILGTTFEDNTADDSGGVFVNIEHTGYVQDVVWEDNLAAEFGGVLSNIRCSDYFIVNSRCESNKVQSGLGGCFYFEEGRHDITGGVYEDNTATRGGMLFDNRTVNSTIVDAVCASNTARAGGCASYVESVGSHIENCLFRENSATGNGGSIIIDSPASSFVIDGSLFLDGIAEASGGFLHVSGAKSVDVFRILGTSFENGRAVDRGGTIFSTSAVTVVNATFTSCTAFKGGAIFAGNDVPISVNDSNFASNHATLFGGAIHNELASLVMLEGSILEDNVAGMSGGAVYSESPDAHMYGPCRLLNNWATSGSAVGVQAGVSLGLHSLHLVGNVATRGAIHVDRGATLILDDVVAISSVSSEGGVLYLDSSATASLNTSIFFNNTATTGGGAYLGQSASLACHDTRFDSNHAKSGGAIASLSAVISVNRSEWSSNVGDDQGGAFSLSNSRFFSGGGCSYEHNSASFGGIAYLETGSHLAMHDTDVGAGNYATIGGGIAFFDHRTTSRPPDPPPGVNASARFGETYATDLASLRVTHEGPEVNERPFASPIHIEAYDALGNRYLSSISEEIMLEALEGGLIGTTVLPLIDGQAETSDVRLSLRPDVNVTFAASAMSRSDVATRFNVTIRACFPGEVDKDCTPCIDSAKYSFNPLDLFCSDCPKHASCDAERATDPAFAGAVVILKSGYWRSGPLSENIRKCPYAQACKGGVDLLTAKDSCSEKHRGPLCATCKDNFLLDRSSGACYKCGGNRRARRRTMVITVTLIIVVALSAPIITLFIMSHEHSVLFNDFFRRRGKLGENSWLLRTMNRLMPFFKIVFIFSQIVSSEYSTFLFIKYPKTFDAAVAFLSLSAQFALDSAFTSMCIRIDHYSELLSVTLVPLVIVALSELAHFVASRRALTRRVRQRSRNYATFLQLIILYVVYSTASLVICRTFRCDSQFRREPTSSSYRNKSYLAVDYSISCKAPVYTAYVLYSSLMVFVYPVGVPLFFFFLLWNKKDAINPEPEALAQRIISRGLKHTLTVKAISEGKIDLSCEETAKALRSDEIAPHNDLLVQAKKYHQAVDLCRGNRALEHVEPWLRSLSDSLVSMHARLDRKVAHLGFLFSDYSRQCWWFESVECIRRLILTSLLPAFYSIDNDAALIYTTFLVSLLFLGIYVAFHPFEDDDVNRFAVLMQGTLSAILFLTIVLYHEERLDNDDSARWDRQVVGGILVFVSTCFGPILILFYAKLGGFSVSTIWGDRRNRTFESWDTKKHTSILEEEEDVKGDSPALYVQDDDTGLKFEDVPLTSAPSYDDKVDDRPHIRGDEGHRKPHRDSDKYLVRYADSSTGSATEVGAERTWVSKSWF